MRGFRWGGRNQEESVSLRREFPDCRLFQEIFHRFVKFQHEGGLTPAKHRPTPCQHPLFQTFHIQFHKIHPRLPKHLVQRGDRHRNFSRSFQRCVSPFSQLDEPLSRTIRQAEGTDLHPHIRRGEGGVLLKQGKKPRVDFKGHHPSPRPHPVGHEEREKADVGATVHRHHARGEQNLQHPDHGLLIHPQQDGPVVPGNEDHGQDEPARPDPNLPGGSRKHRPGKPTEPLRPPKPGLHRRGSPVFPARMVHILHRPIKPRSRAI